MNEKLNQVLENLEYNKVFINTIDGYDNKYLNEFNNWQFSEVYSFEQHKIINIITFESGYAWNEQIKESLKNIRKKCLNLYKYDIIPLDADMCGEYFGYNNILYNIFTENYINKIIHKIKNSNIKLKYLLQSQPTNANNIGLVLLIENIKLNKKQKYCLKYLANYFWKKYKISFSYWKY